MITKLRLVAKIENTTKKILTMLSRLAIGKRAVGSRCFSSASSSLVSLEVDGAIATITLNDPSRYVRNHDFVCFIP